MCFDLEQRWKQHRIKGAPGKERVFRKHKLMLGRDQRNPPPDDTALRVKLGIWDTRQMRREILLAHLQMPGKMNWCERLTRLGQSLHDLSAGHILGAIK